MQIPTIQELIAQAGDIGYTITQPNKSYTEVRLKLDINQRIFQILTQYALLIINGLALFDQKLAKQNPQASDILGLSLDSAITDLEKKGAKNYQGWIGEMISDFVLRYFIESQQALLEYNWYALGQPKGDVNDHGLDIVAAYAINGDQLGHLCGEIKTYNNLSQGKTEAYRKLMEAYENSRDPEIRRSLNLLFQQRTDLNPIQATLSAMGRERSFLPSVLHNSSTGFARKNTFRDMPLKFKACSRPSQRIGIQISIAANSDSEDSFDNFFKAFMKQMHLHARCWTTTSSEVMVNV